MLNEVKDLMYIAVGVSGGVLLAVGYVPRCLCFHNCYHNVVECPFATTLVHNLLSIAT